MRNIQGNIDTITLNKPWLHHISHDLFGIAERIRDIFDGYFIVRNVLSDKYEVHNSDNIFNSYEFVVPYDELDARTLEYCRRTQREYVDNILLEMQKNNEKLANNKKRDRDNAIESMALDTAHDLRRAI